MKASRFAASAAQVVVLVACIIMLNAGGVVFVVGMLLGVASIFWYAAKGMYLKGWIGRSEARTQARLRAVEAALEQLDAAVPDAPENRQQRQQLKTERESLRQELGE